MITPSRAISKAIITAAVLPAISKMQELYAEAVADNNPKLRGEALLAIARLRELRRAA